VRSVGYMRVTGLFYAYLGKQTVKDPDNSDLPKNLVIVSYS